MTEFTIKQIAEFLDVSKPTVQRMIKELEINPERRENNNRAFYSYADTVTVISAIRPSFDFSLLSEFGAKPQNGTATPPNVAQQTATQTAKPQNFAQQTATQTATPPNETAKPPHLEGQTATPPNQELEILRKALSIIEAQLAEKDRQLAIKDKQIQDLSNRLEESMQLTKGQQYIAAADKAAGLLEVKEKKEKEKDLPKKEKKQKRTKKKRKKFIEELLRK